jgi:hypothetical protein
VDDAEEVPLPGLDEAVEKIVLLESVVAVDIGSDEEEEELICDEDEARDELKVMLENVALFVVDVFVVVSVRVRERLELELDVVDDVLIAVVVVAGIEELLELELELELDIELEIELKAVDIVVAEAVVVV